MKGHKKNLKESQIIEAAEQVFAEVGFKNAKMEDIAAKAGITKVTLYSYFHSKENMYMAVTYKALSLLIEKYYETIDKYRDKSGLECVLAILDGFMSFCEEHYLYSEALLEYFALVRSSSAGRDDSRLTEAMKDSLYYMKLQDMHNLPFKLTVKEIERGKADGSIQTKLDPMLCTLHGWTMVVGYVKVVSASGTNATPLFNVSLKELKKLSLRVARELFRAKE
ncbi:MAG: TetR/AcrR family transcriptional regulator [Saprospiraceae bacterium]|jgi:AcrR family transcriptional regulator|nr:TetR/AcrR family transcriptional regulator [Saprospiraceae bacterium]